MSGIKDQHVVVRGLAKEFRSGVGGCLRAIESLDLVVKKEEIVCLLGPSGSGKSTFLNILAGLLTPTAGSVTVFDKNPVDTQRDITFVQQTPNLLPFRSVLANAALELELRHDLNEFNLQRVFHLLEAFGLQEFLDCMPFELSGGMRQKVAIARSLAVDAPLILCDEPLASLDLENRIAIEELFWRECRDSARTSIFVTHQIDTAMAIADSIAVLSPRPAEISEVIQMATEYRGLSPRERREHKGFSEYYLVVWEAIRKSIPATYNAAV